jgi:hypothetical protein
MLPFLTDVQRIDDWLAFTPMPEPALGVQTVGIPLQVTGPAIPNPFRSMLTLDALTRIPSVFASGTARLLVSR